LAWKKSPIHQTVHDDWEDPSWDGQYGERLRNIRSQHHAGRQDGSETSKTNSVTAHGKPVRRKKGSGRRGEQYRRWLMMAVKGIS
jgi:hypothetical protein